MYYLYHIPGVKIGVTTNLENRVERQQGYYPEEYQVIMSTKDIDLISKKEVELQRAYGYSIDEKLYKQLKCNQMKINVTNMTTTFPCPVNKLKGQLMDNIGLSWETEHGDSVITKKTIDWIMDNVQISKYTDNRCYIYNRAFARWFDNNDAYRSHDRLGGNLKDAHMRHGLDNAKQMNDQYNGKTLSGGLSPEIVPECCDEENPCICMEPSQFDLIREWAEEKGLYDEGDLKTQTLKLMEEAGEVCRAVLKDDYDEIVDGIGDCVVVLTNLAELNHISIEECIEKAYEVISKRTGKMVNGTFKKD